MEDSYKECVSVMKVVIVKPPKVLGTILRKIFRIQA